MCCSVLQCVLLQYVVAVGRSVFQRVAVCVVAVRCCSRSQDVVIESGLMEKLQLEQFCLAACCSVLQRVAVCCSVLQRVAVCCSVCSCIALLQYVAVGCSVWLFSRV